MLVVDVKSVKLSLFHFTFRPSGLLTDGQREERLRACGVLILFTITTSAVMIIATQFQAVVDLNTVKTMCPSLINYFNQT